MKQDSKYLLILAILCVFTFFINNEVILPDIMECRNIVTAREMVDSGNMFTPTMNGVSRLEKPPLPTWIAAVSYMISPDNLGLQRAMAGGAATLMVFAFYLFGALLTNNKRYAFISSIVLCTSYSLILMGRTATWDIYCHAFMMCAIYFILRGLLHKTFVWGNFSLAGIMLGLSLLGKGPVSFYALLLPAAITFLIMRTGTLRYKILPFITMILICALMGAIWPIGLHFNEAVNGLEAAISKESSSWINYNVRPWYYYWQFFLETGVWAVLTLVGFAVPYWMRKSRNFRTEYLFPLLWMVLVLVLLSCVPEKKPRYLLPILIPASFVSGYILDSWMNMLKARRFKTLDKTIFRMHSALIAVIVAAAPVLIFSMLVKAGHMSVIMWVLTTILLLIVVAIMVLATSKLSAKYLLSGIAILFVITEIFLMPYINYFANNIDRHSIRAVREMTELNDIPFKYSDTQEAAPRIEIVYEAGRQIRPVNLSDSAQVMQALPFALLTQDSIGALIPENILSHCNVSFIDQFDDNQRPKTSRRHSKLFVYDLYLLTPKE